MAPLSIEKFFGEFFFIFSGKRNHWKQIDAGMAMDKMRSKWKLLPQAIYQIGCVPHHTQKHLWAKRTGVVIKVSWSN